MPRGFSLIRCLADLNVGQKLSAEINYSKVIVFSGAGISAESGIQTYRDSDGLWREHDGRKIASIETWNRDPKRLIDFFNHRVESVKAARPNAAHEAVAQLEEQFEVVVITQNIDDLHERAGSTKVLHLHGSMLEVYPDGLPDAIEKRGLQPINFGEVDSNGRQIRPNVVLFGEEIHHREVARQELQSAGRVLVVGTSLMVEPAASLLKKTRYHADRVLISKEIERKPYGFKAMKGLATELVPSVVKKWRNEQVAERKSNPCGG